MTKRDRFQWVSEVAYKNVHRIVARGYDTTELVEQGYGLTDVLFIDFQARIPLVEEDKMLNYVMVVHAGRRALLARRTSRGSSRAARRS